MKREMGLARCGLAAYARKTTCAAAAAKGTRPKSPGAKTAVAASKKISRAAPTAKRFAKRECLKRRNPTLSRCF